MKNNINADFFKGEMQNVNVGFFVSGCQFCSVGRITGVGWGPPLPHPPVVVFIKKLKWRPGSGVEGIGLFAGLQVLILPGKYLIFTGFKYQ
jgi:hypothetical protein